MEDLIEQIEEIVIEVMVDFGQMGILGVSSDITVRDKGGVIEVDAYWEDTLNRWLFDSEEDYQSFAETVIDEEHPSDNDSNDFKGNLQSKFDREGLNLLVDTIDIEETEAIDEYNGHVVTTPIHIEILAPEENVKTLSGKSSVKATVYEVIDKAYNDYYDAKNRGADQRELGEILNQIEEPLDILSRKWPEKVDDILEYFKSGAYEAVTIGIRTLLAIIDSYENTLSYLNGKEEPIPGQWGYWNDFFLNELEPYRTDLKQFQTYWANVLGILEELGL